MVKNKIRTTFLIVFTLFSGYCMVAPVLKNGTVWNLVAEFFFPIFLVIFSFFPSIFFVQSYYWGHPFRVSIKFIYFIEGIGMLTLFVFMIGGMGMSFRTRSTNDPHYSIFMGYLIIQSILFSLWSLLLSTPLSNFKLFNWPFEHDEERAKLYEEKRKAKRGWIPPRER